jgi:hypothetical protein
MESSLATLIILTAVLFGVLTFTDSYFATEDQLWQTQTLMEDRAAARAATAIEALQSEVTGAGSLITLTFRNVGSHKLADYDQWDLIVQHYSAAGIYQVQWLPYNGVSLGNNQWTVAGIYLSAVEGAVEHYNPGIWDPGEEIVIQAKVLPPVGPKTVNLVTLAVDNGHHQSILVERE